MRFVNPNFRDEEKKLNNEIKNEQTTKENIISLDSIMNQSAEVKNNSDIQIELIDYPKNAKIIGVPRSVDYKSSDLGIISIKYESKFGNVQKSI